MSGNLHAAALVAVMAGVTMLLRALPFLIFREGRTTPAYISYLGNVLPQAIIGMLVIYCLKDMTFAQAPYGCPELIAGTAVVALQAWRRNSLVSILSGTALYMILIRLL